MASSRVISENYFCLKSLTDQSWNCAAPSGVLSFLFWYIHPQPLLRQTHLSIILSDPVVEVI